MPRNNKPYKHKSNDYIKFQTSSTKANGPTQFNKRKSPIKKPCHAYPQPGDIEYNSTNDIHSQGPSTKPYRSSKFSKRKSPTKHSNVAYHRPSSTVYKSPKKETKSPEMKSKKHDKQQNRSKYPKIIINNNITQPDLLFDYRILGKFNQYFRQQPKSSNDVSPLLFLTDIQSLLMQCLCIDKYLMQPRWCKLINNELIRNINFTIVDGLSADALTRLVNQCTIRQLTESYMLFSSLFDSVYFISPKQYKLSWDQELWEVPTAFIQNNLNPKFNGYKRKAFPLEQENEEPEGLLKSKRKNKQTPRIVQHRDTFNRMQLLLTPSEQQQEQIVMNPVSPYTATSSIYSPVTAQSPLFAVDCEMVDCQNLDNPTGKVTRLASLTLINEKRQIVYTSYVKPQEPIIDYHTQFSGITEQLLKNVDTTLAEVQLRLQKILPPDAILVGHSIVNDLNAMQITHPYIIDTSVIYHTRNNMPNFVGKNPWDGKDSLRKLAAIHLNKSIQQIHPDKLGHYPSEDALASLDLVLLKLSKSPAYGNAHYKKYVEGFSCILNSNPIYQHGGIFDKLRHNGHTLQVEDLVNTIANQPYQIQTVLDLTESSACTEGVCESQSTNQINPEDNWWPFEQISEHESPAPGAAFNGFNVNLLKLGAQPPSQHLLQSIFDKLNRQHTRQLPHNTLDCVLFIDNLSLDSNTCRFSLAITPRSDN